ncbi:hypothetical protein Dimus_000230 [Dionaea muscipula]
MSTAGLELKNSPNLKYSWKKVAKVRNTARRPASKMIKLGQQPGNGSSPKRVEAPEVAEFGKSHRTESRPQFSASIEHVPIKKRRLLLQSSSPPTLAPLGPIGLEELYDGPCDSDPQISLDSVGELETIEIDCSNAEGTIHSGSGEIVKCKSHVCRRNDDFSGIVMLADAACSGSLENCADNPGRSAGVGVQIQQQDTSASAANRNGISGSSESAALGKVQDESTPMEDRDETTESFVTSDSLENLHCNMDGSLALLSNDSGSNDTGRIAEDTTRSPSGSRDDRFHWDLNVVMNEWDEPLHDTTASGLNSVENTTVDCSQNQKPENVECSDMHDEFGRVEKSNESMLLPSLCKLTRVEKLLNITPSTVLNSEEHGWNASGPGRSFVKDNCVSSFPRSYAPETSNPLDSEVLVQMKTRIAGIRDTLDLQSDDVKTTVPADNQKKETAENFNEVINGCSVSSVDVAEAQKLCVKVKAEPCDFTCQQDEPYPTVIEKHEIAFFHGSESSKASDERDAALRKDIIDHGKRSNENDCENELGKVSYQPVESHPVGGEITANKLETLSLAVCKSEDVSLLVVAVQSESPADDGEMKQIIESTPVVNPFDVPVSEYHPAGGAFPDQVDIPANNVGKFHTKDLLDGDLESHISHEDRSRGESTTEIGGYDSHLEDGELIEPVGLLWEENEGEEAEHVDYDSDNRDGYDTTDATDDPVLSLGMDMGRVGDEQKRSLSNQCNYKDDQLTSEQSTGQNGCCLFSCSLSLVDVVEPEQLKHEVVETHPKAGRKTAVGSDGFNTGEVDNSENVGDTSLEVVGVTTPKRELQSQIEGPVYSDKKDADYIRRNRSNNTSVNDGDERQTGSDESMGKGRSSFHLHSRYQHGNRSWNYGVKSAVANSATADGDRILRSSNDTSLGVRRSTIISTSKSGGYSQLLRKGLAAEKDNEYGLGKVKLRDVSPDNAIRGRFDRCIGINRGCREGYRRPGIYENINSAGAIRSHFGRSERSFSPICNNRVDHLPQGHRRSRSRSRSHSPNFRSEARIGRMRIPYQPNNYAADHMRDRRSPPARMFIREQRPFDAMGSSGRLRENDCIRPIIRPARFSDMTSSGRSYEYEDGDEFKRKPHPPRNHRRSQSRSRTRSPEFRSEARMGPMRVPYQPCTANHMSDRRSPVRVFQPGQRFENNMTSPGRTRSDNYVRPIMRPVRYSDTSQSGRGAEYEGDELRRKPRKIFDRIHPMRHYEMDGEVRRFQYDAEEDNNAQQNFRSTERRSDDDMLRRNREERGSARYNSNRLYYSGPKSVGMRDFGDDTQPRAIRH